MGFIYKVTNIYNGKIYIGKTTKTVQERFEQHLRDCINPKIQDRPFYKALRKYGSSGFSLEVLEELPNEKLDEKEKEYIKKYNSYIGFKNSNGYNATLGGDGTIKYNYKTIIDYYLLHPSKEKVQEHFNCSRDVVNNACKAFNISTISNCQGQTIFRIDPKTHEKKEYNSIRAAALEIANLTGKNFSTIRKRINYIILHKTNQKGYGYYWKKI